MKILFTIGCIAYKVWLKNAYAKFLFTKYANTIDSRKFSPAKYTRFCHKSSYDQPDINYPEIPHLSNHYARKARASACCLATFIGLLQEGLGGKRPGTATVAVALEAKLLSMTGLAVEVGLMVGHSLAERRREGGKEGGKKGGGRKEGGGREGGRKEGGRKEGGSNRVHIHVYTRGKSVV